jgi:hypothetical protein
VVKGYLDDDRMARSGEAALYALRLSGLPWAQGDDVKEVRVDVHCHMSWRGKRSVWQWQWQWRG